MKKILIGLLLEFIIIIIFIITKNEVFFVYATQIIGFGSIGVGIILSGLVSNNIYRRTVVEDEDQRFGRLSRVSAFILFGAPSIITLIIYYYFFVR